jgi:hypothetical protein
MSLNPMDIHGLFQDTFTFTFTFFFKAIQAHYKKTTVFIFIILIHYFVFYSLYLII